MQTCLLRWSVFDQKHINEAKIEIVDFEGLQLVQIRTKTKIETCLVNQEKKLIYGFIQLSKIGSYWFVDKINSFKGYGPVLYEISMMSVWDDWVRPSNLITTSALNVWYKFMLTIETESVSKSDSSYFDKYRLYETDIERTDSKILEIINTKFKMKPTDDFIQLYQNRIQTDQSKWIKLAQIQFYSEYDKINI